MATNLGTRPRSFVENVVGGAMEGVAAGTGSAAKNILSEAVSSMTQNLQPGDLGKKAREFLGSELTGLSGGANAGDTGKKIGEWLSKEGSSFFQGINANPAQGASDLSDMLQNLIKNLKLGKISETVGDQLNDAFDGFADTIDVSSKGQRLGEEFRNFAQEATREAGQGIRQSLNNTLGEAAKGMTLDILPYALIGIMAVTAAPLAMYYLYYKAKHSIGSPKLATEIHQRHLFSPITERVGKAFSSIFGYQTKPIYNETTTRRIGEIIRATQNTRKHGGYFQNVLFYGPGGTGKTMISEYIAENSGMSYVKMSGGDLAQYIKRGEHVTELNKLMDKLERSWRPWSTEPWVFVIDEAESLCKDRSKIKTPELLELQNALLNRTGKQSNKFKMILLTNRMEDIDEAILSRMDHKIYVGPPAEPERAKILKTYIPQFFTRSEQAQFFQDAQVAKIAKETQGQTGRALFKLLNALANKKTSTDQNKLSQAMIDETVKDFVQQEKEILRRREAKEKRPAKTATAAPAA